MVLQDRVQRGARQFVQAMPDGLQDPVRRGGLRTLEVASVPFVTAVHLLQVANKLRVDYPWSTPTAPEVAANYARGLVLFGRSRSRRVPFEWRSFPTRAVITRETAKIPRRLRPIRRRTELEVRFDQDFELIIRCCREGRRNTWITPALIDVYRGLHSLGFVATVGTYLDSQLVAGIWGIGIGRVFGIMSMFHLQEHAGSLAMAALVDVVSSDGRWSVIDCGPMTPNFERYGAREIPEQQFCELIWSSLKQESPG